MRWLKMTSLALLRWMHAYPAVPRIYLGLYLACIALAIVAHFI